jgi:hypothetical protein
MEEIATSVCRFRLDLEGLVLATMVEGARFEPEDARAAVAATWRIAGERRRPVLVDSRGVRHQSREARAYFAGPEAAKRVSAVAVVVGSPVSRMIGSFFLRTSDHRIPTRLFDDEAPAREWLREFLG